MNTVSQQIEQLVASGETEAAIETLTQWARQQPNAEWIRQCVLVRGRWEKLQRDMITGIADDDDARQETNQINVAILNLVNPPQPPVSPDSVSPKKSGPSPLIWLLIATIFALIGVVFFVLNDKKADEKSVQTASRTAPAKAASGAVSWPKGKKASLSVVNAVMQYEILEAALQDFNPDQHRLVLNIRCTNGRDYDSNFWDDTFRFELPDGTNIAPSSGLNEIVPGHSAKTGEVVFLIPQNTTQGTLQISVAGQKTKLPVEF
ncbi:MAG: hypothetical protein IT269_00235 [Saprospiraceae bacterium]|nr:hypothetical protein [Saprospiraceae bacterium]